MTANGMPFSLASITPASISGCSLHVRTCDAPLMISGAFHNGPSKLAGLLAPGHWQGRVDPATHLAGGKRGIQTQVGLVSKPWLITAVLHCPSVPGTGKGFPWWPGVKHLQGSEAFSGQCSGSIGIELSEGVHYVCKQTLNRKNIGLVSKFIWCGGKTWIKFLANPILLSSYIACFLN